MPAVATLPVNPTLGQRLTALDQGQRIRLALGIALFVAIAVVGLVMGRQAEWRVLYSNLADKDGGAVIAQLTTMNVPYKYTEGGGAILVPADRVHDVRLKLASQGLPKGAVSGFEMMEANRFGMTQFQERLTFQRGLEGELTRSIQALSSVSSARVHLALPNQNGFFREQQKPSASVLLSLHPGRALDKGQLAGIVHLVASSVPEMNPSAVSVLDDTGKLLSANPDAAAGVDAEQLQYVQQIEQLYSRRILDMLEPLVGKQNVKAQVTAELDFSQTESTTESHKPNQTPDSGAVRSQQLVESTNGTQPTPPAGVPGATTNQPPAQPAAPINGQPQALAANGQTAAGAANSSSKKESIINYEVDKTIRVTKGAVGTIKRINAAVVLNNQSVTDAKGVTTSVALTEAQLEKMTALVRETVGFNQDRGDSVNVVNAPFAPEKAVVNDTPVWRQPEVQELARSLAWPLGTLGLAALVLLGVIRPAMKALTQPAPVAEPLENNEVAQLDAIENDQPERPQLTGPGTGTDTQAASPSELRLEDARKLTRDNPAAVANIVKAWMNGEAPA
ncbi:flagellar basal-body MS-ring/collar protein FliF [Rhodoferax mekongensis]|uniref:flagellar basal-body MS-ring/collar protein FliF n=1 Tax=Rhodoferax mekongensis TaxID=3068341 RepID=UPI0028BDCB2F|nr:flagellar basal-body MS-ring/collar protein FliF [Rhodoferax sp. TBRC 17199]MDT7514290.1 flagellar basal-body MS-ring/collar protein FliF [Rhodoferax sp. TBRC 17199]